MKFVPQKYELVYFTRSRKAFNLEATVNITGAQIEPKGEVRVLGVWLDTKLKWGSHAAQIAKKMSK